VVALGCCQLTAPGNGLCGVQFYRRVPMIETLG